ncbi:hypothetical protein [Murimonas intestini]|uniref:DUF3829 domain-containing protein n=1 Tax=Murimonas intestini TaxID=1337051 RepID=A0AB73SXY5_9FIRM|nr:hypothetical protein [Murimonas intestini]MCR1843159.1 hypothetical protein [Murimonas intestini]MCR1868468.1 hypothetical protein [Murimonas intestini]MCR1885912.1 hypothetical protein [Murimonas intestini]
MLKKAGRSLMIIFILCLAVLSGCGKADQETSEKMMDDFGSIIGASDELSAHFDTALTAVEEYIASPSEEGRKKASDSCSEAQKQLETAAGISYEMSDEVKDCLEKKGISAADFMVPYQTLASEKDGWQDFLTNISYYLDDYIPSMGEIPDELKQICRLDREYFEENTKFMYYGINSLFAGISDEEMEYLDKNVLAALRCFQPSDVQWEKTSEGADQKMEACMQQMEEIYMKMSAVYGAHLTGSE